MTITTFDQFQEKFQTSLIDKKNKESFIDNEIREIESYLFPQEVNVFQKRTKLGIPRNTRQVFEIKIHKNYLFLLAEAFQGFDLDGGYETKREDEVSKNVVEQARQFCKYYNWLKQLKATPNTATKKSNRLSHKQKMLALHYLGLNLNLGDNKKLAVVLSEILDLNEDNTRQYLSYVSNGKNDVRTKANLTKVNQLFKNQDFNDISKTIETDLEKL
ncbi:hypothetical protein [Cellulophaga sp. Asnod2-G02]|uniref:hypothetical protein n=1 Tax=Cellulophaga sp. Asnod2-G02 TaxID=3160572 RepID=UPI00386BE07C